MNTELFRVALIGPESTGKSTICEELAKYFNTKWVHEYARDYLSKLNRRYTKEDIIYCAKKQLAIEAELESDANKILFSDTELINYKVWLLDVFGECPDWIEKEIINKKYSLYLLTNPDIPFVDDSVRENPYRRDYFYEWYKAELEKRNFPFEIIKGTGVERITNAIQIVKKCLT